MRRLSGFSLSFQKLGFLLAKRENPASPAEAQEGRHQWFPPSDFLPFPKIIWCKPETGDRCEKGERQRIFSFVSFSNYSQCQIPCCYTGGFISAGAAQGELPEGQERVPWGMTVPRNSFVGCLLCIPSNFTFIFHSPVSIFNLVLFTLYKTPISSLLTPTLHNLSHLDTCILRQLLLSYKDVRSD